MVEEKDQYSVRYKPSTLADAPLNHGSVASCSGSAEVARISFISSIQIFESLIEGVSNLVSFDWPIW